ncbi:605_t:CDS:2 [Funneliformis geosporum]|nr:605_t:CDS:2 [Funneliformis geosporum]
MTIQYLNLKKLEELKKKSELLFFLKTEKKVVAEKFKLPDEIRERYKDITTREGSEDNYESEDENINLPYFKRDTVRKERLCGFTNKLIAVINLEAVLLKAEEIINKKPKEKEIIEIFLTSKIEQITAIKTELELFDRPDEEVDEYIRKVRTLLRTDTNTYHQEIQIYLDRLAEKAKEEKAKLVSKAEEIKAQKANVAAMTYDKICEALELAQRKIRGEAPRGEWEGGKPKESTKERETDPSDSEHEAEIEEQKLSEKLKKVLAATKTTELEAEDLSNEKIDLIKTDKSFNEDRVNEFFQTNFGEKFSVNSEISPELSDSPTDLEVAYNHWKELGKLVEAEKIKLKGNGKFDYQ